MIVISSDYSEVYAEISRLESMPTVEMAAGLDAVLTLGFETARAKVHVKTGKLKLSGKKKTRTTANTWSGQFSFPAKNSEGVSYGMYERDRGGDHDFFNGLFVLHPMFKAAMAKGLRK